MELEGTAEITLGCVVFVPDSLGGMTCGTSTSATEGEKRRKRFRGEEKRAVGRFRYPGRSAAAGLFLFLTLFFFYFS
jgi:hypothetical protein